MPLRQIPGTIKTSPGARSWADRRTHSTSSAFLETVNNPNSSSTAVSLQSDTNPTVFGSKLTFSATVTPASATGTVTFFDGGVPLTSALPLSKGTASFTTSALGGENHAITAQYSGDGNFSGSLSPAFVENVTKAASQVVLELSLQNTAFSFGTSLSFMATVTPAAATGWVSFFDGTKMIAGPMPISNGSVTFTTSALALRMHSISAQCSGDANYAASSSSAHPVSIK